MVKRPPNTRVQRTRSSASRRRSPLTRYPLGGVAHLVFCIVLGTGVTSCRQPDRWGTPAFERNIARLQIASKCEKAISLLLAANARDDPHWYELLIEAKLDCAAKPQNPRDRDEVLALVNEGIQRFPKSSRLVFLKGWVNSSFGELGLARKYYQDALDLASANIVAEKGGRGNVEDRSVAENARANLGAARRPGS